MSKNLGHILKSPCSSEELTFTFYFILITLALNSHPWLAVTTGDSAGPDGNDVGPGGSGKGGKTWPEPESISRAGLTDFSMCWQWAGWVVNGPGLGVVKSGFEFWLYSLVVPWAGQIPKPRQVH